MQPLDDNNVRAHPASRDMVVAVVGTRAAEGSWSFASHALSVAAIALTVVAVYAFSILVDGCSFRDLGFAQVSWSSIAIGFVLAGPGVERQVLARPRYPDPDASRRHARRLEP